MPLPPTPEAACPEPAHGEWVERCAARLHDLWPEVDTPRLAEVAEVLWSDRRSTLQPEYAALLAARACGKSRPLW
ncbi:MAG: hypothetical protein EOP38_16875 [Rubrivivax sp.]|nr:MAG: hypothetical protein EOP38_16875 [Rubrivivax sp.]